MGGSCGVLLGQSKLDPHTLSLQHFEIHRFVGKGGFGKVNAVIRKKTSPPKWFALKTLSKVVVVQKNCVKMIWNERNLLSEIHSPHIVQMHHAFQDIDNCYVVMDLLLGGDLKFHLKKRSSGFQEDHVRFYVAGVLKSLSYLHSLSILHRDIKPENIILDNFGYPRLTDLGISVRTMSLRYEGNSGTGSYMAPELFYSSFDHGVAADFYSVGILAFQLLFARKPWKKTVALQLESCPEVLKDFPESRYVDYYPRELWDISDGKATISPTCQDFLRKLLHPIERCRLGFHGFEEVIKHEWLNGFDWSAYESMSLRAPFVPEIDESKANCNTAVHDFEDVLDRSSRPSVRLKGDDQKHFEGFEYNVDIALPQT